MPRRRQAQPDELDQPTARDAVLLYTAQLAELVRVGGDLRAVAEVVGPFPPSLGPDEHFWISAPYGLRKYRSLGDGSWSAPMFIAGGTGAFGAGLLAGSVIGNASASSKARRQAAADAMPRWVLSEQGALYISRYGFYLAGPAPRPWDWASATSATMVGPGSVHMSVESTRGPIAWIIDSDWSELVFVLWALAQHPAHPQLLSGGWLPPGWIRWAAAHNQPVPSTFPGLTG